jgi:3-oxoadipate enol-lactonase
MDIEANGIRLHYRIDGLADAPWVTFVTGIANDLTLWDGQVLPLERDFRILRYDFRGHGGSEATSGEYSLSLLTADLLALWDALEIERTHLVGLGLGGAIIQGLAADHPGRVASLMPCCCRADMTPDFAAIWPPFVEVVKQHGMEGMVERTVQRWFTEDFRIAKPDVIESVRRMIRRTDPLGYIGCIAAFLTLRFGEKIGRIRAPTLYVSGADDQLGGPPPIMQALADQVPGARHVSVPNAAHICNLQNPSGFNSVLSGFMGSVR